VDQARLNAEVRNKVEDFSGNWDVKFGKRAFA
jgi:hypothetical protein